MSLAYEVRQLMKLFKLIRVGKVDSLNPKKGTVSVVFLDLDDSVHEMPLLSFEYNLPVINQDVLCVFLSNDTQEGFCLGGFYSEINPPPTDNKDVFIKKFDDGTSIEYNKETKELTLKAANPITINGDLHVNGRITSNI